MSEIVGQYQQGTFTAPTNGTTTDADDVRGNDNDMRTVHNSHDADPGVHFQSSTLAARPGAGTAGAGAKWLTSDGLRLYYSNGATWSEIAYLSLAGGGSVTAATTFSGGFNVNGGTFTSSVPIQSSLATGTAPFSIASTTMVPNLNADMVDGQHAAAFAAASHSHLAADLPAAIAYENEANTFSANQRFNSLVALRVAPNAAVGFYNVTNAGELAGTTQWGQANDTTVSSGATTGAVGIESVLRTQAAAFTVADAYGLRLLDAIKGAGSSITRLYGLYVADQTAGVTNYAIYTGAGLLRFGGQVRSADGSVGTPEYAFENETNTGLYRVGAGEIGAALTGNDAARLKWTADGTQLFLKSFGSASNPQIAFQGASTGFHSGNGVNTLALTIGGQDKVTFSEPASGETLLKSLRYHNGTAAANGTVTVGAADSGGAGFRVLRVPN